MRSLFSKLAAQVRKSEAGFTLVELLVVVGIIVALAAVIIPNVARFTGKGTEGANTAEAENVQTAFDTLMADAGVASIQARSGVAPVNNFSAFPLNSSGNPLQAVDPVTGTLGDVYLPTYLRGNPTTNYYCWSAGGLISTAASTSTCP